MPERGGRRKVLFGTNFPMLAPSQTVEGVAELGLDGESRELYLHGNAERLLGL
jgi:predicted TIM-barrel fold metal-dependent hydrolase